MKGLERGLLYNQFKDAPLDPDKLETEIKALMIDDDVTNKKGIYSYILTRDERYLNIRAFTEKQKHEAYERQNGICPDCGKHFAFEEMQGDHITRGARADIQPRIIAKCVVRIATAEKRHIAQQIAIIHSQG